MEVAPQLCAVACGAERHLCAGSRHGDDVIHAASVARSDDWHRCEHGGQSDGAAAARSAHFAEGSAPTSINHQNASLATTISFNLADGQSLSDAQRSIEQDIADIGMPTSVHGSFQGRPAPISNR